MGHYSVVKKNNEEALRVLLCNDLQDIVLRPPDAGRNVENALILVFGTREMLKPVGLQKHELPLGRYIQKWDNSWEGNPVAESLG